MILTDLPKDVIYGFLRFLRVRDIVFLSQTCHLLRDYIEARHVWITQLQRYDHSYPMDLPPFTEVNQLSDVELRTSIVQASRWYEVVKHGILPEENTPRSIVTIDRRTCASYRPALSIGKKLLFLHSETLPRHRGLHLQVICVETSDIKYTYSSDETPSDVGSLQSYAFESVSETATNLLLVGINYATGDILVKLKELRKQTTKEMIIQNLSSLRIEKRSALYLITDEVALSGEYVAIPLSTSQMRSIIVWNWGTNHYTEILLGRRNQVHGLNFLPGHLIYYDVTTPEYNIHLHVVPLRELFSTNERTVEIGSIENNCSQFELNQGISADEASISVLGLRRMHSMGYNSYYIATVLVSRKRAAGELVIPIEEDIDIRNYEQAVEQVEIILEHVGGSDEEKIMATLRSLGRSKPFTIELPNYTADFLPSLSMLSTVNLRLYHRYFHPTYVYGWSGIDVLMGLDENGDPFQHQFISNDYERYFVDGGSSAIIKLSRYSKKILEISLYYIV